MTPALVARSGCLDGAERVIEGGNGVLWQQGPFPFDQGFRVRPRDHRMQRQSPPPQPTVRPVSLNSRPPLRRGLRLHEGLALALLCLIMAGGWIVTLTG